MLALWEFFWNWGTTPPISAGASKVGRIERLSPMDRFSRLAPASGGNPTPSYVSQLSDPDVLRMPPSGEGLSPVS